MAKEIERKFLVINTLYRSLSSCNTEISQGYLSADPRAVVRVRLKGDHAFLTLKGPNHGSERDEWEYEIPVSDARELLSKLATGIIVRKTRYIVPYKGYSWEVDEFHSPCAGLTVAEIELPDPDAVFELPPFIGREVTGDPAYYNSSIAAGRGPVTGG